MSTLRNRVQLIGNPGSNPEVKSLENGNKLARFSLATNESYKNAKGERVTDTQWHNVVAWGKTADLVERFVEKGREVALEGKLVTRNYQTDAGETRYVTEVVIQEVVLLSNKAS